MAGTEPSSAMGASITREQLASPRPPPRPRRITCARLSPCGSRSAARATSSLSARPYRGPAGTAHFHPKRAARRARGRSAWRRTDRAEVSVYAVRPSDLRCVYLIRRFHWGSTALKTALAIWKSVAISDDSDSPAQRAGLLFACRHDTIRADLVLSAPTARIRRRPPGSAHWRAFLRPSWNLQDATSLSLDPAASQYSSRRPERSMHVEAIFAAALLAGFVEFACLCEEAPMSSDD